MIYIYTLCGLDFTMSRKPDNLVCEFALGFVQFLTVRLSVASSFILQFAFGLNSVCFFSFTDQLPIQTIWKTPNWFFHSHVHSHVTK
ncbi:hypothetical protein ACSBR2_002386 [Camellia fascicularis]